MKMRPAELGRELAFPIANLTTFFALSTICALLQIALWLGVFGLVIVFFVVPAAFRFLMTLLQARARGQDPEPPSIDDFLAFGTAWSLFPILYLVLIVYTTYLLGSLYGAAAMVGANVLIAAVMPASLAILVLTHSPVESLKPAAIGRLISRCGGVYWTAPTLVLLSGAAILLSARYLPDFPALVIAVYVWFALYCVVGAIIRPLGLQDEVGIHEPVQPDKEQIDVNLIKERKRVLNHAYGFIGRDNRAGGFKHILNWIAEDPDPVHAWQWFFDQMLCWEDRDPALLFGQQYLSWLLHNEDYVVAVKVMARCRMENEAFKPLPEDKALALEAAVRCQHEELITLLR
jgi:hypothetical protein